MAGMLARLKCLPENAIPAKYHVLRKGCGRGKQEDHTCKIQIQKTSFPYKGSSF